MKKTLKKRVAQIQQSVLPRISVESLESRTLLSGGLGFGHAHAHGGRDAGLVLRAVTIDTPADPQQGGISTDTTDGPSASTVTPMGQLPWTNDGHGHKVITGKIVQIGKDGSSTSQDVNYSLSDGSPTTDDSSDNSDNNSTDCPTDPTAPTPPTTSVPTQPQTPTGSKPGSPIKGQITRPDGATPSSPGGTGGASASSGAQTQNQPPAQGPTPVTSQDSPVVQPAIVRPTQPTQPTTVIDPTVSLSPTVTPLAMTPAGPKFTAVPVGTISTSVNASNNAGSVAASIYVTSTIGQGLPAVHEVSHLSDHTIVALAAITPPINFLVSAPAVADAAPVQVATGLVHVSDIATGDNAPAEYIIAAAAPSLPARIAYNFVRFDAAAFHDAARTLAVELAALNVTNNNQSHTRAWAITAGVLGVDMALLVYWHRQARKRRKQLQVDAAAV